MERFTKGHGLFGKLEVGKGGLALSGLLTERSIDLSSVTVGTTTDGAIMRVGTGISGKVAFSTAGMKGFALYMDNTATSGTFTGMRLRSGVNPSSGSNSVDNLLAQVSVESGKDAATVNVGFFELVPKGTNTITTGRVLLCNADSAAAQTMTTQIIGHFRVHTRGDETITNDEMLRLENEAVGGNGRQLDSAIRILGTNLSGGIVAFDAGIAFNAQFNRAFDLSSITVGATTDGAIMRIGTGISGKVAFSTAGMKGFALYMDNTATSGTFTGMRLRSGVNPASGSNSVDNLLAQVSVESGKDAATVNVGFFELVPKGTNTITTGRVLLVNADSAAAQTMTTQILGHFRVHTRGDETITNDEMLRLENEAVGGNGRQLDSFIRVMGTTLSGGIKAAAFLIDAGVATDVLATALLRIGDDQVVGWDAENPDTVNGAIKVVIGTATRYIQLYSGAPS